MDEEPGSPQSQSTQSQPTQSQSTQPESTQPLPAAAWYPDPFGRHQRRWWDGTRWTNRITDHDTPGIDPPGIDPSPQAPDLDQPAEPITDAVFPIPRRKLGVSIGIGVAFLVIVGLCILIGIELTS